VNWPTHSDQMGTEATALLQQLIGGSITPDQVAKGLDAKLDAIK